MIIERTLDDISYIYYLENKSIVRLDRSSYEIWKMLKGRENICEIVNGLHNKYPDVPRHVLNVDINNFVESLHNTINGRCRIGPHDMSQIDDDGYAAMAEAYKLHHCPLHVQVEVTRKCNCRCIHCYLPRLSQQWSYHGFKVLLSSLYEAGALFLNLTGGELFLLPDIWKMLEAAIDDDMALSLFTNGTLLDADDCRRLCRMPLDYINISVYGSTAATHDSITRLNGSFKKTTKTINMLNEHGANVSAKYILMQQNVSELRKFITNCKRNELQYTINYFLYSPLDGSCNANRLRLHTDELVGLIKEGLISPPKGKSCAAGRMKCRIGCDGSIYPCELLPISQGNVISEGFLNVWNRMRDYNIPSIHSCIKCQFNDNCYLCPGAAYMETSSFDQPAAMICNLIRRINDECDSIYTRSENISQTA